MLKFLKSKTFLIHLSLFLVVVVLLLTSTYYWLGAYTKHGEMIVVPDLKGKQWQSLEEGLSLKHLRLKIADSSIYIVDKPGGQVIEQDPLPGSMVKENRAIYVTVSKIVPPQVKMPNIIDVSDRQAEAILLTYGLKTGERKYQPDLAKDAVLEISSKGRILHPGDEVPKGTIIDLLLGDGFGNVQVSVPILINLTEDEAIFVLKGSRLITGTINYDENISDKTTAIVYKQWPVAGDSIKIKQGESVDIYLKRAN